MGLVHVLRVILVFPVTCTVMFTHGFIVLWTEFFWNLITQPRIFWTVKSRDIPPKCLQDNLYGIHQFATGVRIHYVENGDRSKPLMLFVHGFPESWFSWRHQLKYFSKFYWVVAMDLRGYGQSDKPEGISNYTLEEVSKDIYELVIGDNGLNRQDCILVGHDWGAALCYLVAAQHPETVSKLIIMNGPHPRCMQRKVNSSIVQMWKSWYIFFYSLPRIPEATFFNRDLEIFSKIFTDSNGKTFVSSEELEVFKYYFSTKDYSLDTCKGDSWRAPINYYRAQTAPLAVFTEIKMEKIRTQTLIIWGEDDYALEKSLAEMTRDYVENLTVISIPDGHHHLQQQTPKEVHYYMENFLSPC